MTRLELLFPNHPYFERLHFFDEAPLLEPARVPVVSGAFMMIPGMCFELLGGMENKSFLHVDDSDLCLRVHLNGGECRQCARLAPPQHEPGLAHIGRMA